MVRVGGGSLRGGKVVPHAGGFQALMDGQALWARMRTVELLRTCCEEWRSETLDLHSEIGRLKAACLDLDQIWRISQHCMIQLLSRLEAQQEWACGLVKYGGSVGEIKLPATELSLPALPGLEYPDPGGSGLAVPVLGAQLDWVSGYMVPLAGTMEDADGKGLVPIHIGAQTVDPVSGDLASVVGARLDFWKRTVVPVTVSQCQIIDKTSDIVVVEALQKECSTRARFWRQQKAKEEQLVSDLESALRECLYTALQEEPDHIGWSDTEKQLQEAAAELQEAARTEALRRSAEISELSLLLPEHVLLILTGGDDEEWNQQCHWHTELTAVLNRVGVFMAKQQWDREPPTTLVDDKLDKKTRQREIWEQLNQRRAELDVALTSVNWTRELNQLHADTAEAMLSGEFWYRDYSPLQLKGEKNPLKAMAVMQHRILPQLERLIQLLEESKRSTFFTSSRDQRSSGKDWNTILQLSPLFQLIQEVEQQLRTQAQHAGLLSIQHQDSGRPFIDFLDAQWESEGELVQVSADSLGPREFLIYQHGQFLFQLLHTHKVVWTSRSGGKIAACFKSS
ncbi:uncharacterized protein LOC134334418 isoform X2 [Trichomycterus rosablanca]|uniref:uncharacterized protein LOC134334418 isoform X2 n=1 Tax=Trichomycterus rosablanca TaxID=2290929 RepID=UPI002F351FB8